MDERILACLKNNEGQTLRSPREDAFGSKTRPFKIIEINEELERVGINFIGGAAGLPLFFWMIDRALGFIEANQDRTVRIGARVKPPFEP